MNKDKRNFLDEEKEIEKLLSEFENEDIKIPDELDERLNDNQVFKIGIFYNEEKVYKKILKMLF